jgi:hypothetical protein
MDATTAIILITLGVMTLIGVGAFGLFSIWEDERRAAYLAFGAAVLASLPIFLASLLPVGVKLVILGVLAAGAIVGVVLFLLPVGRVERGDDVPRGRFDERDIMFARARLSPGSPEYVS